MPAVVSVVEKINEPRYPSFKGIMAAKKKPVETLDLAGLGIAPSEVGLGGRVVGRRGGSPPGRRRPRARSSPTTATVAWPSPISCPRRSSSEEPSNG